MMCLWASNKEKNIKKIIFLASLKSMTKRSWILSNRDPEPDTLVRGTDPDPYLHRNVTDPQHWLRVKVKKPVFRILIQRIHMFLGLPDPEK
jgi:hypothetical protein